MTSAKWISLPNQLLRSCFIEVTLDECVLGHRYIHPIFQLGKFQHISLLKTSLHQFSNCVSSKCLTCLSFQVKQTITLPSQSSALDWIAQNFPSSLSRRVRLHGCSCPVENSASLSCKLLGRNTEKPGQGIKNTSLCQQRSV